MLGKSPPPAHLEPSFDLLQEEYLLIQAWKKTVSYIRHHNWYVDTLQLDRTAINLRSFIAELQQRMQAPKWENRALRIVLAPKSQRWRKSAKGEWIPDKKKRNKPAIPLRPLADVDIGEQVVATALMLCLANRVETAQGDPDPRDGIQDAASRRKVISYGNRLFCDRAGDELRHRWGSSKLYRAYYQDYKQFLSRSDSVAKSLEKQENPRNSIFIVHSDLKQFYDRVRPRDLADALQRLKKSDDEQPFFDFAEKVLDWTWDTRDKAEINIYTKQADIDNFERVALPQGLVASGFFANIVLLDFDRKLRQAIGENIAEDLRLEDACRYVDDLRITLTGPDAGTYDSEYVKEKTVSWLEETLAAPPRDLQISEEKTKVSEVGKTDNPVINQSIKMNSIQSAISGGFDALGGIEILDSIQSLMRSQEALHRETEEAIWKFSPLTDVRKETIDRFSAARYRVTYRSIRPLLSDSEHAEEMNESNHEADSKAHYLGARTQRVLDEDMRIFALGLIERWVTDRSNVRLLRIGFDLWPDPKILREVLDMLVPLAPKRGALRRVAQYCLSELLRAGATETGWVEDEESLPSNVDITGYREVLRTEAEKLVALGAPSIPWYLRQQALLYLAVQPPAEAVVISRKDRDDTKHYWNLIGFLRSGNIHRAIHDHEFANLAVLACRSFPKNKETIEVIRKQLTLPRADAIAARDPSLAYSFITQNPLPFSASCLSPQVKEDFCLEERTPPEKGMQSLADIVLKNDQTPNFFQNELATLHFAEKFLEELTKISPRPSTITPGKVWVEIKTSDTRPLEIHRLKITADSTQSPKSLYTPPDWCGKHDHWRFNLGFLIRFMLTEQPDFTRRVFSSPHWKEKTSTYRKAECHWYQRLHGLYNGQQAFGGDWIPITDWMEQFLLALLHWPGCRLPEGFEGTGNELEQTRAKIKTRLEELNRAISYPSGTQLLTVKAQRKRSTAANTLRICVAQTAVPEFSDFQLDDLSLSESQIRKRHRNHLSAALAAIERIMNLRSTHVKRGDGLDWLILPELAVHPKDVTTHLVPFARAHKTLILAGLTYEQLLQGQPLQNSAIWILPEWSESSGLQLRTRRQGKQHLSPAEKKFNDGRERVQGFRPCQWLVRYPWSTEENSRPLMLTGSICYDATDLEIITALRNQSDVLAIPSLNPDVRTFDQMAQALHYHMFQLVIVANNGQYGGSNAYWPAKGIKKQIFHVHGQPQASITFFEIDNIEDFQKRSLPSDERQEYPLARSRWKYPPAGLG